MCTFRRMACIVDGYFHAFTLFSQFAKRISSEIHTQHTNFPLVWVSGLLQPTFTGTPFELLRPTLYDTVSVWTI
jgi:hypothetical protein